MDGYSYYAYGYCGTCLYGGYSGFYYFGYGAYVDNPALYDPGFYSFAPYGYTDGYYAPLDPDTNFIGGPYGYYGYGAGYDGCRYGM